MVDTYLKFVQHILMSKFILICYLYIIIIRPWTVQYSTFFGRSRLILVTISRHSFTNFIVYVLTNMVFLYKMFYRFETSHWTASAKSVNMYSIKCVIKKIIIPLFFVNFFIIIAHWQINQKYFNITAMVLMSMPKLNCFCIHVSG